MRTFLCEVGVLTEENGSLEGWSVDGEYGVGGCCDGQREQCVRFGDGSG